MKVPSRSHFRSITAAALLRVPPAQFWKLVSEFSGPSTDFVNGYVQVDDQEIKEEAWSPWWKT